MRLLEKRTEVENEIMKMYNTEKAEYNEDLHLCVFAHFCTFGIQLKNHEKRCGHVLRTKKTAPETLLHLWNPIEKP